MENQIERIKAKLIQRLQKYLDDEVIDEIRLEPLPIEKIVMFENEHHIKLPKGIVDFYTKISNGVKLYPDEDICNLEPFENWQYSPKLIQKDFDIENDVTYDDYCVIKSQNGDYSFENFGNIALMDLGCAMSYCIVVKGKHYGEMIVVREMYLEITKKCFLDWIEDSIDGTEELL